MHFSIRILLILFLCFPQKILAVSDIKNDTCHSLVLFDISTLGNFCFPINGKLISHYGKRGSIQHTGTDIKLQKGDSVRAAFSGLVTKAERYYGYGLLVIINHPGGFETYYAHLCKCIAQFGDSVKAGQVIGLGGRTGRATTTHLHFELRKDRIPYNPEKLFNFDSLCIITNSYPKDTIIQKTISEIKIGLTDSTKQSIIHVVKKGDTLYSLARCYSTSVVKLEELNNLSGKSKLNLGQKLKVN